MSVIFRQCKNRMKRNPYPSTSFNIDYEFKNIYAILDKFSQHYQLFENRFRQLEEKCQRWIRNEQIDLLSRIEKLENDNRLLQEFYRREQERRKEDQSKKKIDRIRNPSTCLNQSLIIVEEQDQKQNNCHSHRRQDQTMTTVNPPSTRSKMSTARTNKLYFVLNDQQSPPSQMINLVSDDRHNPSTLMTFNKDRTTTTNYSNHQRLPIQTLSTTNTTRPSRIPTTKAKTRIPVATRPTPRVSDLDALMAEQTKTKVDSPTKSLFLPETVKLVRSEELKLFSFHIPPDRSSVDKVGRELSPDSLNESQQKSIEQNSLPLTNFSPSKKSLGHRLTFPNRFGRLIFHRRNVSESDIYQKICSKDQEIEHNVYHLDTIRDYSMEFYMLTSYGSDSQLRAWLDINGEDIIDRACLWDESRSRIDEEQDDKSNLTSESFIQEELDWYPETFSLSTPNQPNPQPQYSTTSNDDHLRELFHDEQFSASSSTLTTSAEWTSSAGLNLKDHPEHSPSLLSVVDETLEQSRTAPRSNSTRASDDHFEMGSANTSIITDQFQPGFYYLCPRTKTDSFSTIDHPKEIEEKS